MGLFSVGQTGERARGSCAGRAKWQDRGAKYRRAPGVSGPASGAAAWCYFIDAAKTLSVVAPTGFLVMTGSLLPFISVSTVRA